MIEATEMVEHEEQATRLVVKHGQRHAVHVNVFNEVVEDVEDLPAPPPVRVIAVTEEMRRRDAEQQRARAAAAGSAWTIKSELRAENLVGWTNSKVQPGRVQPKQNEVRVARVAPERTPRVRRVKPIEHAVRAVAVSLRVSKMSLQKELETALVQPAPITPVLHADGKRRCGCGTKLQSRTMERGLCNACFAAKDRRERSLQRRLKCSSLMCTRRLRQLDVKRADGLCGKCGGVVDRREQRQKTCKRCQTCNRPLRIGTLINFCKVHNLKTVLTAGSPEEWRIDKIWATLPPDRKAVVVSLACKGAN